MWEQVKPFWFLFMGAVLIGMWVLDRGVPNPVTGEVDVVILIQKAVFYLMLLIFTHGATRPRNDR